MANEVEDELGQAAVG